MLKRAGAFGFGCGVEQRCAECTTCGSVRERSRAFQV